MNIEDAILNVALGALKKSPGAREKLDAGVHEVDRIIRVTGTPKVGKDGTTKQVNTVPWIELFAVALSHLNGVTVESILREALDSETDVDEIKARAQAAIDSIKGTTTQTKKGPVNADLTVQAIDLGTGN